MPIVRSSTRSLLISLFVVLSVLLAACSRSSEPPMDAPAAAPGADAGERGQAGRALARRLDVSLSVGDIREASTALRTAAERSGGFVAEASAGDDHGQVLLMVPAGELDHLRDALAATGEIRSEREHVEDVTDQAVDLEARLVNARAREARIRELLAGETRSIGEVLEVEKELSRARETVERLTAEQGALAQKVELVRVQVSLSLVTEPVWNAPLSHIGRALEAGVRGAAALAVYGAMVLAALLPLLVPVAALVTLVVLLRRRRLRLAPAEAR